MRTILGICVFIIITLRSASAATGHIAVVVGVVVGGIMVRLLLGGHGRFLPGGMSNERWRRRLWRELQAKDLRNRQETNRIARRGRRGMAGDEVEGGCGRSVVAVVMIVRESVAMVAGSTRRNRE